LEKLVADVFDHPLLEDLTPPELDERDATDVLDVQMVPNLLRCHDRNSCGSVTS
jgi:hypothetical protein